MLELQHDAFSCCAECCDSIICCCGAWTHHSLTDRSPVSAADRDEQMLADGALCERTIRNLASGRHLLLYTANKCWRNVCHTRGSPQVGIPPVLAISISRRMLAYRSRRVPPSGARHLEAPRPNPPSGASHLGSALRPSSPPGSTPRPNPPPPGARRPYPPPVPSSRVNSLRRTPYGHPPQAYGLK